MTTTTQSDAEAIRQQVARVRTLAENAQQKPWSYAEHGPNVYIYGFAGPPIALLSELSRTDNGGIIHQPFNDARFIAASRTIVPTQASQIEMLVDALEKIEDGCADPPLLARIALAAVRERGERDE